MRRISPGPLLGLGMTKSPELAVFGLPGTAMTDSPSSRGAGVPREKEDARLRSPSAAVCKGVLAGLEALEGKRLRCKALGWGGKEEVHEEGAEEGLGAGGIEVMT